MRPTARLGILVGVFCGLWPSLAGASFEVKLTFNDKGSGYSSYYDQIIAGMRAAGDAWGSHIVSSGVLRVQVNFLPASGNTIMSAKSDYSTYVRTDGGFRVYQLGALTAITNAAAIPSAKLFDATLNIHTNYLANSLWFDPNPTTRSADVPVPDGKIDAQSVFLHEMGHMLFMNGWRAGPTGALPGDYMSTFDQHVIRKDEAFFFDGERAKAVHGGLVPLNGRSIMHVGGAPGPGYDLHDLMNPTIPYGQRLYITPLDLAIAADTGIRLYSPSGGNPPPSAVPEPASLALLGIGLLVAGAHARHRGPRRAA